MKQKIMYIFTRTPLHVGAGSSVGAIDSPIQRERHTGFPIIPGSSLKGVLRDMCRMDTAAGCKEDLLFGKQDDAGRISISEAKILVFPVRSAKGSFAFITCPLALERFRRECPESPSVPQEPSDMTCLGGEMVKLEKGEAKGVVLEEYRFYSKGDFPKDWENALLKLLDDPVWQTGKGRFVLLGNGDFSHFVKNACEVAQHVAIMPETGTAKPGALFNLEAVPAETLFFSLVTSLNRPGDKDDAAGLLADILKAKTIAQFGGDSTTGLGFCTVKLA